MRPLSSAPRTYLELHGGRDVSGAFFCVSSSLRGGKRGGVRGRWKGCEGVGFIEVQGGVARLRGGGGGCVRRMFAKRAVRGPRVPLSCCCCCGSHCSLASPLVFLCCSCLLRFPRPRNLSNAFASGGVASLFSVNSGGILCTSLLLQLGSLETNPPIHNRKGLYSKTVEVRMPCFCLCSPFLLKDFDAVPHPEFYGKTKSVSFLAGHGEICHQHG